MKPDNTHDPRIELTEEEMHKILVLKHGLEDLNLFLLEIEDTYQELDGGGISTDEQKHLKYRLKMLEQYIERINESVNKAMEKSEDDTTSMS